jgi:hypothetical protein
MDLRACKKCQIVNDKVELYYHELKWQGPPEYLCIECQKKAFQFQVFMLIVGTMMNKDKSEDFKADTEQMLQRIRIHAQKNRITEDYWMKLVDLELSKIKKKQDEFEKKRNK